MKSSSKVESNTADAPKYALQSLTAARFLGEDRIQGMKKMENGKRKERSGTTKRTINPAKKTVEESRIKRNVPETRSNDDPPKQQQVAVSTEKLGVPCHGNTAITNSNSNSDNTARESGHLQTEQQQQQQQLHFQEMGSNCDERSLSQSSVSPNRDPPPPPKQMLEKTRSEPEPVTVKAGDESQLRKVKSENWYDSAAQPCNLTLCHSNDHPHQTHGQQQVSVLRVDEANKSQEVDDDDDDDVDKLKPSDVALLNNTCVTEKEVQESLPKEKASDPSCGGEGEGQHQLNKSVGSDDHKHNDNGLLQLDIIIPKKIIKSKRVLISSSVTNFPCPSTPTPTSSPSTPTPTSSVSTPTPTPTSSASTPTPTSSASTPTPTSSASTPTSTSARARSKPLASRSVTKSALINSQLSASNTPEPHGKLQSLVDLVMWRDVSKSAFIFGMGTFLIISSSYAKDFDISLISVASYSSLLYLALIFVYDSFMNSRGRVSDRQLVLSEDEAVWFVKLLLPYLNESLLKLRSLFSGDPAITMKLAVVLFVLARCGSSITIWNMLKFGFFGVFVIPKLCSSYSSQITAYANFWVGRFRDAWESCSHKKALAFAIFTIVWNFSSLVARVWAAFMLFVAFRYYQQHSLLTNQDDSIQGQEPKPIGLSNVNVHVSQHYLAKHKHIKKEKKSF